MRYGVLEYKNPNVINIGDGMQIISVLGLYEHMGIKQEEIVRIDYFDLQTYEGEEVVLPICFPFYGYNKMNRVTCFSPKIKPVFLSLSLFDTDLEEDEISYLKKFEPIGCRDEFTADGLAKKGIKTYLNGCMTLTLSTEKRNASAKKVYGIDIPQELVQYMPEELRKNLELRTSIFKSISMKTDEYARCLLDEYAEQAELVITSRLHAAVPCFAAGIPVVFVNTEYSYRFSWLEEIFPVYLPKEYGSIDWKGSRISDNQKALEIRKLMVKIASDRLAGRDSYDNINYLQEIYNGRIKREYTRGPMEVVKKYLKEHWNTNETVEYGIWGINQAAASLIAYIEANYPCAKCVAAIDAVKTEKFKGIVPKKINDIDIKDLFIFVTASAANPYALEHFQKSGKDSSTYLFLYEHIKLPIQEIKEIV